ncbi:hypothetical protein Lal_00003516 [Lupinus albus]|nr:hypothetical protein Lal_00003516 [Lupinus albus]
MGWVKANTGGAAHGSPAHAGVGGFFPEIRRVLLSLGFSPRRHLSPKRVTYLLSGNEVVDLSPKPECRSSPSLPLA